MDIAKWESTVKNLKFGEVLHCETDHCEICGTELQTAIHSNTFIYIKDGLRLCYICFKEPKEISEKLKDILENDIYNSI